MDGGWWEPQKNKALQLRKVTWEACPSQKQWRLSETNGQIGQARVGGCL